MANTTKYQPANALTLGKAAKLAYDGKQKIKKETASWGFGKFEFFDRDEPQAFVAGNDDAIIVAFRGTQPNRLQDWISDADFDLVDGPFGKVHNGFYKTLRAVWGEVLQAIGEFGTMDSRYGLPGTVLAPR